MPSDAARDLARRRFLSAPPTPADVAAAATRCRPRLTLPRRAGHPLHELSGRLPDRAIRFALAPGGARPRIEPAACTGYDECALVCPVNAIALDVTCQTEAPDA